jgi:hypothetical protein
MLFLGIAVSVLLSLELYADIRLSDFDKVERRDDNPHGLPWQGSYQRHLQHLHEQGPPPYQPPIVYRAIDVAQPLRSLCYSLKS